MATSGNFLTSPSGQGGGNYYDRMIYEWWRTGWGRSGGVGYHNVSYQLKSYGGNTGYWINFWQGSMNTDGTGHTFASPTQVYSGGATVFGPYSKTMYTDSAGNRSFSASAQGGVYYNTINTSGSGSWSLDNIPMYGSIQSVTPNTGLTDETTSIVVDYLKYTGIATLWFRLDLINNTDTTYKITNPADPYTWSGFATWLRTSMVNTNSTTLYILYGDDLDSSGTVDNYQAALTYPITIKNDTGQANPTFTDFTFQDTNATTSSITGNNQVLIQGKSTLEATVSTANKATANKNANMSSYTFTIGSYTSSSAWSNVSNVVKSIGTVSDVTGTQNLSVTAVDSRTNAKTVTKSLTILPYASPAFVPSLTVKYTNSYDTSSGITVTASGNTIATISPLTLSGNDKNSVNGTSGVQFDVSKSNNTSYTGSWVNVATSRTSGSTDITATLANIGSSILSKINGLTADNTVRWYIKFKIVDALETQYYETFIDIGKPIFRIGTDTKIYNNEIQVMPAIDEDDFISNLDTRVPTQQSVKAYIERYATPAGTVVAWAANTVPNYWLFARGQAISRTTYSDLFNVLCSNKGTVTITIASPGVVTLNSHGFLASGESVYLTTTGALPTGLTQNTLYYIIYVDANTFRLATSRANALAGTAINTSGTQSGTHTLFACPHGLGDGSTTFNVPDLRGRVLAGRDIMGGTSANRLTNQSGGLDGDILGNSGGLETHTLTTAQIPGHQHGIRAEYGTNANLFSGPPGQYNQLTNNTGYGFQTAYTQADGGSGGSHNNVQPTFILNYIIKY